MVTSVHTNAAAMTALQNLNRTTTDLDNTTNRVSTGFKVNGAQDNAAVFAVAQNMRGDVASITAVRSSLDRASSIADVALAAGETISDLLIQMREKAVAAKDPSIDGTARLAYNENFRELLAQINTVINSAEFDGANILDGSITGGISFLADVGVNQVVTLNTEDMSISGSIVTLASNASLGTVTLASTVLTSINASLDNVNSALARLGSTANRIESHSIFVGKLQDSLERGIGNLVDADLAKESARLQALQVKQQLTVQSLSIANQGPQTILSLFQN